MKATAPVRGGVSEASRASARAGERSGRLGRICKRGRPINRHYVSRRNFTERHFFIDKRADSVMSDYRMTVRFAIFLKVAEAYAIGSLEKTSSVFLVLA
jgi:hypothetical protein